MEGVSLTPEMAVSICKNGKTLQILNLKCSYLVAISSYAINYFQEIIECCQELKEVDMDYRISANSCRDNYSFFELWVQQLGLRKFTD